jgi:CoA:oxalate CoA-transferase
LENGVSSLLEGVRVIDLTNVLAGPFCGFQLALLGAEVIKVEVPGAGDLARQFGIDPELSAKGMGTGFLAQNAGKKSVTLNLKSPEGKEAFRRLVKTADVVLENFRPGVMDRLGCGYEDLKKIKPDLVYCAVSGFGQDGPWRNKPAYDQIIQGLSGIMSVTGDDQSAPLRVGFPVCDTIGGLTAAFAVCAALFRRSVSGEGQFADVSLIESTLVTMGWAVANYLMTGKKPKPSGNENITASPSGLFKTSHGDINISANTQDQFVTLCRLIGRPDLSADDRFSSRTARMANRATLKDEIEDALIEDTAEHWEERLNMEGVPSGRVLSVPDILRHPHIQERNFLRTLPRVPGIDRDITVSRSGFRLSGGDPTVDTPPPLLGQHNDEIFTELGFSAAEIEVLKGSAGR